VTGSVPVGAEGASREAMDRLYGTLLVFDEGELRSCLCSDVFVFTPRADGVLVGVDAVVEDLRRWSEALRARDEELQLRVDRLVTGAAPSGAAEWIFDRVTAVATRAGREVCSIELRVTALLTEDAGWRLAAGYWSVPYDTQERQDQDKRTGKLTPGIELSEELTTAVRPVAESLADALAEPRLLPGLYSDEGDHVTIGSVSDEVFLGSAGHAAWSEFVEHVDAFRVRGPMRGATVGSDAAWLGANIDIGQPPTPYRFFYVWARRPGGWRICVSHDAVSRDPFTALG
jgi:hypothetical protein